jgi:branched-subunit amino acid ABC-type transport system permease component
MLGGLVVGIAQELSVPLLVWFGRPDVASLPNPTAYSPVAAFLIMILVLLLRPGGLAHGKGTVLRTHAGLRLRNIFIKGGG